MTTQQIDLKAEHRLIVREILQTHLPADAKVWVFGSRETGKARRGSDLDLAIDIGQELPPSLEPALHFAFEDSDLPRTVDIVDMHSLKQGIFRQRYRA